MRTLLGLGAAFATLVGAPAAIAASKPAKPPTPAQIKTAVARAERSRDLWATVNVCHRPRFGIRGEMPALGFAAELTMTIQVDYWDAAHKRYAPLPHLKPAVVRLGSQTQNLHQGGSIWRFTPPARLSGTVIFRWTRSGRVIGETTRPTVAGIKTVDQTDPKGHSSAHCRLNKPA